MSTTTATREEYLKKLKKQLDDWNSEIDKLEARGEQLSGEALVKYNNQVYKLRQQLNSYKSKVDAMGANSQKNWEALTAELDHIGKTIVQSFNYFKSQL